MKKTRILFFLLMAGMFIFHSCTIAKRRYSPGFYIEHANSKKNTPTVTRETSVSIKEIKQKVEKEDILKKEAKENLLAGTVLNTNTLPALQNFKPTFKAVKDSCDTLVLNDGTEILAKIIEVGPRLIRYKHCDNPDGPIYNVPASDVGKVIFSNGSKEEFKVQTPIADYNSVLVSPSRIRRTSNLALLFGILSIPALILYLAGIAFAIISIKNGMAALRWYKRDPRSFDPSTRMKAIAGITFSIIALVIVILAIGLAIIWYL